ncbi:MAG: alpha/beta hydrolase [Pyrinomonadaceae bacterium]|nr:alpha/beta hydrolase [Pyrinomonadaceae bacterium]
MKTTTRSNRFAGLLTRERLIAGCVAFVLFGFLLFFALRWFEHAITFHPLRYDDRTGWQQPTSAQDVWLKTTDGVRLHGWLFETRERPALATIIYFHGNGGNISSVGWVGESLASRGFDVLLIDYRGYGQSEGEVDGETGLYADADASYEYITKTRGVRSSSVVLYGQSLGTAVAVDLASRHQSAALILESGFSSASDLASAVLPILPRHLHFLARNRFDSKRKLSSIKCPVLISHGDPDLIIPTEHGRLLFAAANEPKKLLIFPGAGHNVFGSLGDGYLDQVADFLRTATRPDRH